VETEVTKLAGAGGKFQMTKFGASNEIWFCELAEAGSTGTGCGSDTGLVAQHAMPLQQSAQLAMVAFAQDGAAAAGAGATCIHTSSTLNKIAVSRFTTTT
jgi:hypothetical protein